VLLLEVSDLSITLLDLDSCYLAVATPTQKPHHLHSPNAALLMQQQDVVPKDLQLQPFLIIGWYADSHVFTIERKCEKSQPLSFLFTVFHYFFHFFIFLISFTFSFTFIHGITFSLISLTFRSLSITFIHFIYIPYSLSITFYHVLSLSLTFHSLSFIVCIHFLSLSFTFGIHFLSLSFTFGIHFL
jgi:hypothetical protein